MLLVSKVLLVCFFVLTQVNENAGHTVSRTTRNKQNRKENREVLKKLVDFLNESDRTNTKDEATVVNVLDIEIQNSDDMKTVMKHLQKNYDYDVAAELTHNKPRSHLIRNPEILDDFVDSLQKEEYRSEQNTHAPDILKRVRRYGGFGFGQAISDENYGKRNTDHKRSKYSYQSMYNKKNSRFEVGENFNKRKNYNQKTYYGNKERNYNRQKYGSRDKFSNRDKYESRDRFDSREKYDKRNYNRNKGSGFNMNKENKYNMNKENNYNRNKENSYNRNKENNYNRFKENNYSMNKDNFRNKYDTRNKFNRQKGRQTTFRTNKLAESRIRSRDNDEKGLDIPENDFKKPAIITWNLGMSTENNNANKKSNDETISDHYFATKKTSKDWLGGIEHRKNTENVNNDWSEVGIDKTTKRNNNDWSQVGFAQSKSQKKEWSNVALDPSSKDWAEVGVDKKRSSKRYYNDEEFTLRKEIDEFTTQFAPANTEKWKKDFTMSSTYDWDQPIKHYENKYKNRMEKLYTHEYKRPKPGVKSDFGGYPSFGRTPIPFSGKRVVYAEN